MKKIVSVNDRGYRVGEGHQNALLTDAEVEVVRRLHDEGMSYPILAEKFEMSIWAIGRICRFERRAATSYRTKVVHVSDSE